jgi:hypothetical protein
MPRRKATVEALFSYPGYTRLPNAERAAQLGRAYKKGWEVRLVGDDLATARRIARLATRLGYRPGAVFAKGRKFIVPLYGLAAVEAFRAVRASSPPEVSGVRASHHDLVDLP